MLWKWLSFSDVNSATLCAYVVLAKAVQNGIGGNGILDIQKKKRREKKQEEDGNTHLIHTDWAIFVASVCSLSFCLSIFLFSIFLFFFS